MNVYSGVEYGYNRGYYSYKDANKDIKTHYYIEYTSVMTALYLYQLFCHCFFEFGIK